MLIYFLYPKFISPGWSERDKWQELKREPKFVI